MGASDSTTPLNIFEDTYSYCKLLQTTDHQFTSLRATEHPAPTMLSTAELQHSSELFSHFDSRNKFMQRRIKCFYCKKDGHRIRSCRYKRRNDKRRFLRSFKSSSKITATLISTQDVTCCSSEHDALTQLNDSSSSANSDSLSCNSESHIKDSADMDSEKDDTEIKFHYDFHSLLNHAPMTHCHSVSSSLKLMGHRLSQKVWNFWIFIWLHFSRLNQKPFRLFSSFWMINLFPVSKRKHNADTHPRIVAHCTIGMGAPNHRQPKSSVPAWKKRKKKRR